MPSIAQVSGPKKVTKIWRFRSLDGLQLAVTPKHWQRCVALISGSPRPWHDEGKPPGLEIEEEGEYFFPEKHKKGSARKFQGRGTTLFGSFYFFRFQNQVVPFVHFCIVFGNIW